MYHVQGSSKQHCSLLAVLCGNLHERQRGEATGKFRPRQSSYPIPELVSSGRLEVNVYRKCKDWIFFGVTFVVLSVMLVNADSDSYQSDVRQVSGSTEVGGAEYLVFSGRAAWERGDWVTCMGKCGYDWPSDPRFAYWSCITYHCKFWCMSCYLWWEWGLVIFTTRHCFHSLQTSISILFKGMQYELCICRVCCFIFVLGMIKS